MKFLVTVATLLLLAASISAETGECCHDDVEKVCKAQCDEGRIDEIRNCNALFSGYKHSERRLQQYATAHISASYDHLLLATNMGTHIKNRPGFEKIYRSLSDKAWHNAIDLVKYITTRGGVMDFRQSKPYKVNCTDIDTFNVDEIHSLGIALDTEKSLAEEAHIIHKHASSHTRSEVTGYDAGVAHYIEEEFVEPQTERIRTLSGHSNDLKNLLRDSHDASLSLYLFDEYLQKQD